MVGLCEAHFMWEYYARLSFCGSIMQSSFYVGG